MLIIFAAPNLQKCSNGDVKLGNDKTPEIYWNGTWSPICGNWFWDNDIGVTKFCQKMGYQTGLFKRTNMPYKMDSFIIGRCNANDDWPNCSGGCNYKQSGQIFEEENCANCLKSQHVGMSIECFGGLSTLPTSSCKGTHSILSKSIMYCCFMCAGVYIINYLLYV